MEIIRYFESLLNDALALLKQLVELESPTANKQAVDRLGEFVMAQLKGLGLEPLPIIQPQSGNHIKAQLTRANSTRRGLVLCHLDTVWEIGEVIKRPFRIEGDKAFGPGILDMKASIVLVLMVLQALRAGKLTLNHDLVFLFTSDEEAGSVSSRDLILKEAAGCDYVLVLEPPLFSNRVKTSRKGVGRFDLLVKGKAAHAGVAPESGVNAIMELAHQILALQAMNDPVRGTTVNVTVASGGTVSNVIPAEARAAIDVRVKTVADGEAITHQILNRRPANPQAQLSVTGGINRPPLERTPAVVQFYEKARKLASDLGFELGEGATGGGSDGSFTAALGIPTLDGLGVNGMGPHAVDEHILIADLPQKAALIGKILETS